VTLACLFAALLPQSIWKEIKQAVRGFVQPRSFEDSRRLGIILIVAAAVTYLAITAELFRWNKTGLGQDEQAYLVTAEEVQAGGGPLHLVASLYRGEFAEANRHPLYIGLLSVWPTFHAGKILSLCIGVLTFGCAVGRGVWSIGWLRAGLFIVFMSTNMAWCRFSVTIACVGLLVLIALRVWFQASRIVPTNSKGTTKRAIGIQAAIAGCLLGLAWLTKGTGLLMLAGYVGWLVMEWIGRRKTSHMPNIDHGDSRRRCLVVILCFALAWLVVSSPLLARNLRMHGSAFYNVNSWLMFTEEYEDPEVLAKQPLGEAAREYWNSHTILQIVKREAQGLVWECFILIRMLGPVPFDDFRVLPGALVMLLAILGAILNWDSRARLLLCWAVVFLVMFAWYVPVAAGERFVLPLLIPLGFFAAMGMGHFLTNAARQKWAVALGLAWCGCSLILMWTGNWFEGRI
jgi:hypothetical protein